MSEIPALLRFFLDVIANDMVFLKQFRITHTFGEPAGTMFLNDPEAKTGWMYLVSHELNPLQYDASNVKNAYSSVAGCYGDGDVAGRLPDLIGPTLSPGPISAERWASIGIGFANDQSPPGQALRYVLHWPQQSAELW